MAVPVLEKLAAPWMERREPGVEVEMPTRPVLLIVTWSFPLVLIMTEVKDASIPPM